MSILNIAELVIGLAMIFYAVGLAAVWLFELRRNALYRHMREQMLCLEKFKLSMAVFKAKEYRIVENYRRDDMGIERAQQFILENLLFINRKTGGIFR